MASLHVAEPAVSDLTVPRPRELAMSAAWNAGLCRQLISTDGRKIEIIFHGHWSHGFGPDFSGAQFTVNGLYVRGDIEIHTRGSDWYAHAHHLDSRYDDVALHIVSDADTPETRCSNGKLIPIAMLDVPDEALFQIDRRLPLLWTQLGGSVCAESLSASRPDIIRDVLRRLGDDRFSDRTVAFEGDLSIIGPEPIILRSLCEAFGYSENKAPMRQLAALVERYGLLRHPSFPTDGEPNPWLFGTILGLSGFLPLSPADAHLAGILPNDQYLLESAWQRSAAHMAEDVIPPMTWQTARVRPANHPIVRLMQLATLLARIGSDVIDGLISLVLDRCDIPAYIQELTRRPWHPGIGKGRATAIVSSVLLPFARAYASFIQDDALEDATMHTWNQLKMSEWTLPSRRARDQVTGGAPIRNLGERGHQGLLHLDRQYCGPRRCSRCPIAHAVMASEPVIDRL